MLAGSVHNEAGFSLPGVRIEVRRQGEKKVRWEAVSDVRGEFAVRVPAGPASYVIATASKKHENQKQTVEVLGHERVELIFRLPPRAENRPGEKP